MHILRELPDAIHTKPEIEIGKDNVRYAIIDQVMYRIENNHIELNDLHFIWRLTSMKKEKHHRITPRIKEKNIIIKDKKINRIKISNDISLQCDCEEFKLNDQCKHTSKIRRLFNI